MDQATHNKIISFIWSVADDVLRDLFKRGKYPDVILPMCVIRRMDAVLEPTRQRVLDIRAMLDAAHITPVFAGVPVPAARQSAGRTRGLRPAERCGAVRRIDRGVRCRIRLLVAHAHGAVRRAEMCRTIEKEAEGLPDGLLKGGTR